MTTQDRIKMKAMRENGHTYREIGELYGVSRQRVFEILRDLQTPLKVSEPSEEKRREKMNTQKQTTIQHIDLYIKKVKTAKVESVRWNYINKTVGILSLAKELDIITPDEYEQYFNELYR